MVDLARLTVRLEAENAKLTKALQKSERDISRFERTSKKAFSNFGASAKAAFAGVLSTAVFVGATRAAFDFADSVDKAAKITNLSTDALQEWRFAGEQLGVTQKEIDEGFRRFNRRIGEFANSGAGPAAKAIQQLEIATEDLQGNLRPTEAILDDVVAALAEVEDQARRSALEAQLFGDDAGPKLDLLIQQGVSGLRDLRDEAHEIGAVLSQDVIENAVQARDDLEKLSKVLKVQLTEALVQLAPFISSVAQSLVDLSRLARIAFGDIENLPADLVIRKIEGIDKSIASLNVKLKEAERIEASSAATDFFKDFVTLDPGTIQRNIDQLVSQRTEAELRLGELNASASAPRTIVPFVPDTEPAKKAARAAAQEIKDEYDIALDLAIAEEEGLTRTAGRNIAGLGDQSAEAQEAARIFEATRTPAEKLNTEIARLNELSEQGAIDFDTYARAVFAAQDAFDGLPEQVEETGNQMSEFAIQAARNVQDAFADFLFDPFSDENDQLLANFTDTLRRMAAEAASAAIFESLLGAAGGGAGGGGFTQVAGFFAGLFGGPRKLAGGTDNAPGGLSLVGEEGPELVNVPRGAQVLSNDKLGALGGMVFNISVQGQVDNRTGTQIGLDAERAFSLARRRNA